MPVKKSSNEEIKAGNIYAVPLSENEFFFFRVLFNIREQCVETDKIRADSELAFFAKCCLIEIYKKTADKPDGFKSDEVLIPGILSPFTSFVKDGKWPLAGYKEVDLEKIYFPGFIQSLGMQNGKFIRGEVSIEFPMRVNEVEAIGVFPESFPGAGLKILYLYNAGRKGEIPDSYEDVDRFDLGRKDLYFSSHIDEVRKHAGADVDLSYHELSQKHGFDLSRFYK